MNTYITKTYPVACGKIPAGKAIRVVVLADLHAVLYGKGNRELSADIASLRPDIALVAGDMVLRHHASSLDQSVALLKAVSSVCPVFYAFGNHECHMENMEDCKEAFADYLKSLDGIAVILRNQEAFLTVKDVPVRVRGLELPMKSYRKGPRPRISASDMEELFEGTDIKERPEKAEAAVKMVDILIAHTPRYGDIYLDMHPDVIVSGHYHGGIIRFSEHTGFFSSQFRFFPGYCCGDFHKGNSHMFVTTGLGEHTIPIRIHNPRELLVLDMVSEEEGQKKPLSPERL